MSNSKLIELSYYDPSAQVRLSAYRDGYAAGWFTRYEIIESPLYAENIEEKGDAADDAAKTDLR